MLSRLINWIGECLGPRVVDGQLTPEQCIAARGARSSVSFSISDTVRTPQFGPIVTGCKIGQHSVPILTSSPPKIKKRSKRSKKSEKTEKPRPSQPIRESLTNAPAQRRRGPFAEYFSPNGTGYEENDEQVQFFGKWESDGEEEQETSALNTIRKF